MLAPIDGENGGAALENRLTEGDDDDIETTLRDVRAFLDDPVALLERAVLVLNRKRTEVASWLFFGAFAVFVVTGQINSLGGTLS